MTEQKTQFLLKSLFSSLIIVLAIVFIGYQVYQKFTKVIMNTLDIPCGRYVLQNNERESVKLHVVEEGKYLGNEFIVTGDSVVATDSVTRKAIKQRFYAIKRAGGNNLYKLDLPGNSLTMELTSPDRLRIYVGKDSLVYEMAESSTLSKL